MFQIKAVLCCFNALFHDGADLLPFPFQCKYGSEQFFIDVAFSYSPCHVVTLFYRSLRPSSAFDNVTSSAYSRSPPTGKPCAIRVVLTPEGLTRRDIYIAVASPSMFGFVARINSSTSSSFRRLIKSGTL